MILKFKRNIVFSVAIASIGFSAFAIQNAEARTSLDPVTVEECVETLNKQSFNLKLNQIKSNKYTAKLILGAQIYLKSEENGSVQLSKKEERLRDHFIEYFKQQLAYDEKNYEVEGIVAERILEANKMGVFCSYNEYEKKLQTTYYNFDEYGYRYNKPRGWRVYGLQKCIGNRKGIMKLRQDQLDAEQKRQKFIHQKENERHLYLERKRANILE